MKTHVRIVLGLSGLFLMVSGASALEVSTATGKVITFDSQTNLAEIQGEARVETSTGVMKADRIVINPKSKEGHASGNFRFEQSSGTLRGESADYNWETSTGVIREASGESLDWRFTGHELIQTAPNIFLLSGGKVTSCDELPPHYYIRSSRSKVYTGKRIKMTHARFNVDDTPTFYSPFYTKSLQKKKYKLRLQPGSTSRDGFTLDTNLGIPLTPNTYTNFKYKHLTYTGYKAGIDHNYFLPNIKGHADYEFVRDYNEDPQPQAKEYRAHWNHFHRFTDKLTFRTNSTFQSVQNFGNTYGNSLNQTYVEDKTRGLLSEGEFDYQFSKANLVMQLNRNDKFDNTISSKSFISKITLPRLSYTTTELTFKGVPFKTNFTANYVNETNTRTDPLTSLRYQQTGDVGVGIRRELRFTKSLTVTPNLGFQETWKDRVVSTENATSDAYFGRYNLGLNARQRLTRSLDVNLSHAYAARFKKNQTVVDTAANDHGVENNQLSGSINSRIGRSSYLLLSSGFNFKQAPLNDPGLYDVTRSRITPPHMDFQWEATDRILIDYSETYALYNPSLRQPINTPLNTSGGIQWGGPNDMAYFSQRFSYSKPPSGALSQVIFSNKMKFFLTPKWYLDFTLSYRAEGKKSFDYQKIHPIERSLSVVRDLHCWLFRMEFSSRPGIREASFYIDLKTNLNTRRNVFTGREVDQFIPYGQSKPADADIFPSSSPSY